MIIYFIFSLNNFIHNIPSQNNPTVPGNLNYFNFISERLIHHYSHHCDENPPMLTVSEFMQSLNNNQLFIKIQVQRDNFINYKDPLGCHLHFDDDSVGITNCQISRSKTFLRRKTFRIIKRYITLYRNCHRIRNIKTTNTHR